MRTFNAKVIADIPEAELKRGDGVAVVEGQVLRVRVLPERTGTLLLAYLDRLEIQPSKDGRGLRLIR